MRPAILASITLALVSCAATAPSTPVRAVPAAPAPPAAGGEAYRLAMLATGCWFGGPWTDFEGLSVTATEKEAADHARCAEAVRQVYGRTDQARVLQLRAIDARVVDDVARKVDTVAAADPVDRLHRGDLEKLLRATAAAQRENMSARRAAWKVQTDLDGRRHGPLEVDEMAAEDPLLAHSELEALLGLQAGDLTPDAHALGILSALDRVELSRGLPRHLKVFAVGDVFGLVFGTPAPGLTGDAAVPLPRGIWLSYLASAARAAGYPVPESARTPLQRNRLAWAGVLEGFAQRLRQDVDHLSRPAFTTLRPVVWRAIERLDWSFRTAARSS
jgi:hypothetical protein